MNCRWAWMLPVLSIVTMMLSDSSAHAQGPPPGGPPGMMGGPGMGPGMMGPSPGMYDPDSMGGMGMAGPGDGMMGGDPGMGDCGPGGAGRNGLLGDILGCIAPYGDGGCAAPRWFDFDVGVMTLKRDNSGATIPFASNGAGGPIVLSTDNLDFGYSTSFKFTSMIQWGPGSDIEFTYYGLFGWTEFAQATSAGGNLFSPFSNFGNGPVFVETDNAELASIRYFSTFNNYEANYRQRWQSPNCRYQGSWLYGFRYFQLDEDFNYRIENDTGAPVGTDTRVRTNVNVNNAMPGAQIGGDLWICLLPGLRVGGEGKFALLGQHSNINNTITVVDAGGITRFNDFSKIGDVAFLGDLAAYATYRVNYHWTFKAGIQALYLDGAALAAENFNPNPPNIFTGGNAVRTPVRHENGDVLWYGYTLSMEYLW